MSDEQEQDLIEEVRNAAQEIRWQRRFLVLGLPIVCGILMALISGVAGLIYVMWNDIHGNKLHAVQSDHQIELKIADLNLRIIQIEQRLNTGFGDRWKAKHMREYNRQAQQLNKIWKGPDVDRIKRENP